MDWRVYEVGSLVEVVDTSRVGRLEGWFWILCCYGGFV